MAFAVADRVKETSTTTGTGTLNLAGAEPGYQTFVAGVGGGNTTYYAITNRATSEFEVGIGTVTDAATDTLSRTTVISSSNSDALVDFSAGTKDVICTLPSEKSYVLDNAGNTSISANLTATLFSGSGASLTNINASNVASGTLPDARFPATLPAASGENLTGLNASNLASGTVPDARFPATIPASSGANLTNLNASNVSSGTLNNARLSAIPNSALDNSAITINGTTINLGSSGDIVAGTEWQAVTSTNVTATASQGIFMNSTGGAKTVTLPASPTIGDEVSVIDYAGTSETNNITIGRNGSNIQGSATDFTLATNRGSVTFVYSDGTQGWLIRDRMSGWGG